MGGGAALDALAFSDCGTRLAIGGADGVLTLYEIGAGRVPSEQVLLRHGSLLKVPTLEAAELGS